MRLRRPIIIPLPAILWTLTAALILSLALAAFALYRAAERSDSLCDVVRTNRIAAIADVREQARILVETAIAQAVADGRPARAERLREVVGPAFVAEQESQAALRHPPIDCSDL